jgi:hypothetical protein
MMPAFTDQRQRLRRIVENALADATYESSRSEEDGRMVVLEARRSDGKKVGLRFRGVKDAVTPVLPVVGTPLKLQSVGASSQGCISLLVPWIFRGSGPDYARVRIEAGDTRLEVVCQDAEWWEEPAGGTSLEPPSSRPE